MNSTDLVALNICLFFFEMGMFGAIMAIISDKTESNLPILEAGNRKDSSIHNRSRETKH